ncbi:hypothetical protein U27_01271 [Candidatus Vecturithrix granuli]|uniref:DUF4401 domain-containing protein n=1 Tax=Vecturithrix granuli TaxID=1499967 RepID=A0A081C9W6_VECG1|nr:hypothetical protein U27_01271 [Candidatus Vecturithrix granuli]
MRFAPCTLRELLECLKHEGLITSEAISDIQRTLSSESLAGSSPWYIRILVGFSAWVAAILFLASLSGFHIFDSPTSAIIIGFIFILITFSVRRYTDHLFLNQLAFALNLAGQFLLIGGVGAKTENLSLAAIAAIILECLLLIGYPDPIHRFFSIIFSFAAIVALLYDLDIANAIHLLILLAAGGVLFGWEREATFLTGKYAEFFAPIGYGLTTVLFFLLIPSILPDLPVSSWWTSTIGLLVFLLVLEFHLLVFHQIPITQPIGMILFIGTVIVSIPFYSAPGVIAALLVLLIGFQRGNRLLMGLAFTFLAIFLVAFYYYLDLTLLAKSMILIISGIGLIGLRFLFKQFVQQPESHHA